MFSHTHMHGMHKKLSPITQTYLACCAIFFVGSFCSVFSDISSAIIFVFMAVIIAILPPRSGHNIKYKVSPIQGLVPAFLLTTWKMHPIKSGHSRRRNSLGKTERPMSERKYSLEHITLSAITIFIYNSLLVFL